MKAELEDVYTESESAVKDYLKVVRECTNSGISYHADSAPIEKRINGLCKGILHEALGGVFEARIVLYPRQRGVK